MLALLSDLAVTAAEVERGLTVAYKILRFLIDMRYEAVTMYLWKREYPGYPTTWICGGVSNVSMRGMYVEMQAEAIL